MDGIANDFPAQNAINCRILHIQSQNFLLMLGPIDKFPLGLLVFLLYPLYETATGVTVSIYIARQQADPSDVLGMLVPCEQKCL